MECIVTASKWLGLGLACALGVILVGSAPAVATDSQVEARLCADGQADAALTITSPKSDSVVDTMPLMLGGDIHNITQFDIFVDGQYVTTQAVGSNQSSYQTSLAIAKGTHTVKLVGNDICAQVTPTDSVVVTYQPQANPGNGATTPTTVGPGTERHNDSRSAGGGGAAEPSFIDTIPPLRAMNRFGHSVIHHLDFDALHGQRAAVTFFRCLLVLVGIVAVIFGYIIAGRFGWKPLGRALVVMAGLVLIVIVTLL